MLEYNFKLPMFSKMNGEKSSSTHLGQKEEYFVRLWFLHKRVSFNEYSKTALDLRSFYFVCMHILISPPN